MLHNDVNHILHYVVMQYPSCSQYSQCNFWEPLTPSFLLQRPQVGHVEHTLSLFHLEPALASICKKFKWYIYIHLPRKPKTCTTGMPKYSSYLDFLVEVPLIALLSISLDPLLLFFLGVLGKVWLLWFAQRFNIIESQATLRTNKHTTQLMQWKEKACNTYV